MSPHDMQGKANAGLRPATPNRTMAARHSACADKGRCTGPGCKASTGKTANKGTPRTGVSPDYSRRH